MSAIESESLSDREKNELMEQIKQQVAVVNANELITKMVEKCFKKCVLKPGTSLDSSEQKCVAMCMDRYMDSYHLISNTYSSRIQREHDRM